MFKPQPHIIPISHRKYILMEDFKFSMVINDIECSFHISKDFIYDGISAPPIFWTLTGITPDGIQRAAALIHDYLYFHEGKVKEGDVVFKDIITGEKLDIKITREVADDIFCNMLEYYNNRMLSTVVMFGFVRIFGWLKWK